MQTGMKEFRASFFEPLLHLHLQIITFYGTWLSHCCHSAISRPSYIQRLFLHQKSFFDQLRGSILKNKNIMWVWVFGAGSAQKTNCFSRKTFFSASPWKWKISYGRWLECCFDYKRLQGLWAWMMRGREKSFPPWKPPRKNRIIKQV